MDSKLVAIRVMAQVETDDDALVIKKKMSESLKDVKGARIEFTITDMPVKTQNGPQI